MKAAYLTIDDSPSAHTDDLTDFLVERGVPALLFCRGDMMEKNGLNALVRAIDKGIVLGNHAYHHYRASEQTFEVYVEEIRATEKLIEQAYAEANVTRDNKYFRFPHIDRGTGGWIIDYNQLSEDERADVIEIFSDGLNISLTPPTPEMIQKKEHLQDFLSAEGFTPFPAEGISFPWYQGELARAVDVPYTYSFGDWMLLSRHKGKWPYKSLDDLRNKIDADRWLQATQNVNIILAHDKEEIDVVVRDLIDHCLEQDITFLPIP